MMKKLKVVLLSAALLGGAVGIASATPDSGKSPISAEKRAEWKQKREERLTKRFEAIDANKDGKITKAELETAFLKMADEKFAKMDPNNTGTVDVSQFKAFEMGKQARGKMHRHHRHGLKDGSGSGSSSK
jgi:hypothetical protein